MPQIRARGDDGTTIHKWVDINYDAKVAAKALNGTRFLLLALDLK